MHYVFSPEVEALLRAGKLAHMLTKDGKILPMVIDQSGKIVEIAKAVSGFSLQTIFAPAQLVLGGVQMYQTHRGFQAVLTSLRTIENTLSVLQTTTAVIGVGTVVAGTLAAVNLYQTLKLRQDVEQLKLDMKDGFLNLKKAFETQGEEVIAYIDQVAQDIKFEQHRLEFIKAYGRFLEATRLIRIAITCNDTSIRNSDLANARQTLSEALAIYRSPQLMSGTSAPGHLRRLECAWAIEQTIAVTYQLQDQPDAVVRCLSQLQERVAQDSLTIINNHPSPEELDFIFPELMRIRQQDLAVLTAWQQNVECMRSLPADELKLLGEASVNSVEPNYDMGSETIPLDAIDILPEQLAYENLKRKSHQPSLEIQLRMMMTPYLRQQYENYIIEKAKATEHSSLVPSNLKQASDLTIANLYCYFEPQDLYYAS